MGDKTGFVRPGYTYQDTSVDFQHNNLSRTMRTSVTSSTSELFSSSVFSCTVTL